jgi:hypothetical protein
MAALAARQGNDSGGEPREIMLQATALGTAREWTTRWFRTLAEDGRPIEGGWPGTMHEARARVAADAANALHHSAMAALTREELGRLTRTAYDEARRLWRASAAPG